ncbi:Uncharacterized protein OS=Pirellula staleyi (strain ATCC 27377 / DSM 6068 / ICPB 4128) GN=Psta_3044 PE=4 SV=1 [Gemmata massiliana]|uniref:Uncharacterized protein n=1 Tax=Gemmata massiliana TaxID=1210884 RepID=A0A6P2DLS3_9BACT|nr:hypothetical protein [Gemmata massiliana]VTS02727.1 Uncharacterized protein OS=Pirellula staleyi (strain ATCC 27377 / DSM 6068 / ICPB 4128) GN=Psta_3044 PE=4 SV=1 [Gemmata massiliana]
MVKIKTVMVFGVIAAVTAGVLWFLVTRAPAASGSTPELLKLFGGPEGLAVIRGADKIEAFRLNHSSGQRPTVTEGPVAVSGAVAESLVSVLSSHDCYEWSYAKVCKPVWGVRLSFYRGADRVDVLFCFQCDELSVSLNGTKVGSGYFEPTRPELLRAIQAIFPNDQVLRELPERR